MVVMVVRAFAWQHAGDARLRAVGDVIDEMPDAVAESLIRSGYVRAVEAAPEERKGLPGAPEDRNAARKRRTTKGG